MDQQQEYVGVDLHRRRSVIVRRSEKGETLAWTRVDNADTAAFTKAVMAAGEHPKVVLEATYGCYWAADWLEELGCEVHLAHPLGNNWGNRRVKNDLRDGEDLADLLRMGRLAEAWIAPPEVRELRETVRHRAKLVQTRSRLRCQVHAVLAKEGVHVPMTDLFGVAGNALVTSCQLAPAYRNRVESLRELIAALDKEIAHAEAECHRRLRSDPRYETLQAIAGVGPVLAAIFVAEIGDARRFSSPDKLASWCGLTPRHRESDTSVQRGRITKQGSRLVRWAAVEAAQKSRTAPSSERTSSASWQVAGAPPAPARSPASPWPARSSHSSTTGCETARSPRFANRRRDADRHRLGARSPAFMTPGVAGEPRI